MLATLHMKGTFKVFWMRSRGAKGTKRQGRIMVEPKRMAQKGLISTAALRQGSTKGRVDKETGGVKKKEVTQRRDLIPELPEELRKKDYGEEKIIVSGRKKKDALCSKRMGREKFFSGGNGRRKVAGADIHCREMGCLTRGWCEREEWLPGKGVVLTHAILGVINPKEKRGRSTFEKKKRRSFGGEKANFYKAPGASVFSGGEKVKGLKGIFEGGGLFSFRTVRSLQKKPLFQGKGKRKKSLK